LKFQYVLPSEVEPLLPARDIADDYGAAGAAFQNACTIRREFPLKASDEERNGFERATGIDVRTMLVAALTTKDEMPIGVVQLLNKRSGEFTVQDAAMIETIASVATMAYVNRRLTLDSARASTLLGMGKVSHDIGNLAASLHATIAYSEMALDGLRMHLAQSALDAQTDQFLLAQKGMFDDLKQSVDRIVGYSRLISDMSAGRGLRPTRKPGPLAPIIARSAAFLESDARSKRIAIRYEMDEAAPHFSYDDLYIFRIVQNLVGNAIKAVAETLTEEIVSASDEEAVHGTVTVRYAYRPKDHLLEVNDTGPGMSTETISRILSGDAGSQWSRASGSG
ncbi:HAMP domain-containing histidine kinase, partial [bacterium]